MSGLTTFNWITDESGNDRYNVIGYSYELLDAATQNKETALAGFSKDDNYTNYDAVEALKRYDLKVYAKTFDGVPGNQSTNWALETFDLNLKFNSGLFKNWLVRENYTYSAGATTNNRGTVSIDSNGNWTYTPNSGESGFDSFIVNVLNLLIIIDIF